MIVAASLCIELASDLTCTLMRGIAEVEDVLAFWRVVEAEQSVFNQDLIFIFVLNLRDDGAAFFRCTVPAENAFLETCASNVTDPDCTRVLCLVVIKLAAFKLCRSHDHYGCPVNGGLVLGEDAVFETHLGFAVHRGTSGTLPAGKMNPFEIPFIMICVSNPKNVDVDGSALQLNQAKVDHVC